MIPPTAIKLTHEWILAHPALQGSILAQGLADLSTDQMAKLMQLLSDHGVPEAKVDERAKFVVQKLGAPAIIASFAAKNFWAQLKLAANKPRITIRLVLPDELARHAERMANMKYGAGISDHKRKKKVDKTSLMPPQLDPAALHLQAGHFKDEDDIPVPQIQYQELQVEAHGIAIATSQQSLHWLQHQDSISTSALAILLTEELTSEQLEKFNMTKISFPIFGSLKNLGDKKINRHMSHDWSQNSDRHRIINTAVIRIHAYTDELQAQWQDLVKSPVRLIRTIVPQLQLCAGEGCRPRLSNVTSSNWRKS